MHSHEARVPLQSISTSDDGLHGYCQEELARIAAHWSASDGSEWVTTHIRSAAERRPPMLHMRQGEALQRLYGEVYTDN